MEANSPVSNDDYVIGIDGGGTRSRGVAMSVSAEVLMEIEGGPLNYNATGEKMFQESLADLWAKLRTCSSGECRQILIGTAALLDHPSPYDQGRLEEILPGEDYPPILAMGDASIAAMGALGGEPGVVVISGTGSVAISLKDDLLRTNGGLGPLIDNDPGSALWMAAQAVVRCQSGTDSSSLDLASAIHEYFGIEVLHNIIPELYTAEGNDTSRLASLAAYLATHRSDNPVWKSIETDAGVCLAGLATPLCKCFDSNALVVVTWGSVLNNNERVRKSMIRALGKNLQITKPLKISPPYTEPVYGAAIAALEKVMSENEK